MSDELHECNTLIQYTHAIGRPVLKFPYLKFLLHNEWVQTVGVIRGPTGTVAYLASLLLDFMTFQTVLVSFFNKSTWQII